VIFTPTAVPGPVLVDLERRGDDRGFFARTYCRQEFLAAGLEPLGEQANVSWNEVAGTLRGMHLQLPPATEAKLVRCTAGAVYDVVVDVRPGSPTYLRSVAVELNACDRRALYVPPMFAHGYQTLTDGAEVVYQVSQAYAPGVERGLRHDDPAIGLTWPLPVSRISAKDASWPLLGDEAREDRQAAP
jgi:dTDP-4-dehydrorhamnose 3,5-epimerase